MANYKTTIAVNGKIHSTLKDILPFGSKELDVLFIAKTPAPKSVDIGHYFQGFQGQMFWNKLRQYNIIHFAPNKYEDENLLNNNCGITDIVKVPRHFGNEPSNDEYIAGLKRIFEVIKKHKPKLIVFVYKRVLDNILKYGYNLKVRSEYGFNTQLEKIFNAKVFVFPMPGTPCKTSQAILAMNELQNLLKK